MSSVRHKATRLFWSHVHETEFPRPLSFRSSPMLPPHLFLLSRVRWMKVSSIKLQLNMDNCGVHLLSPIIKNTPALPLLQVLFSSSGLFRYPSQSLLNAIQARYLPYYHTDTPGPMWPTWTCLMCEYLTVSRQDQCSSIGLPNAGRALLLIVEVFYPSV